MAVKLTLDGGNLVRQFADPATRLFVETGNENNEWMSCRVDQIQAGAKVAAYDEPGPTMTVDSVEVV